MKTSTFIKKSILLLFATVLLSSSFALGQTKDCKQEPNNKRGTKMTHKMMELKREVKPSQDIHSGILTKSSPERNVSRTALTVTESGATLYGNLIYSGTMDDLSSVGFYSIDPNTAEYTPVGINEYLAGAGTVIDGIAYISYAETLFGYVTELYTIAYDVKNATIVKTAEHNPEDFGSYAVNMAHDYTNDVTYALTYSEDGYAYSLSEFNRDECTYTKIADLAYNYDILAMTFDNNGTLYVISDDGIVKEMDPATGTIIRHVCNTGFMPAYMQSACWSPKDNKILWAASNDNESHIISIDVTTGACETLCSFNLYEEWTSLYTTDPMAPEDAPAKPVIQYSANTPGSLLGSIIVETPTKNVAGEDLTDAEYTLVIELNGTNIYNSVAVPGNNVTMNDVTFVEGMNTIRSYAVNETGKGDIALKKIYAGNDTPLPVSDIEVTINDDNEATLKWTAPSGGKNGGYLDLSSLTYTIKRSGVTIATAVTNNYYVDQLPSQIAAYEWSVYAVSGDKTSEPVSTGKVIHGDALPLPYEQTFDDVASLELYTIVDANGDSRSWGYDDSKNALTYSYNTEVDADDYAFTPPLQLSNSNMLYIEVNACAYSISYSEKIEIILVSKADLSERTIIIPETQLTDNVFKTLSAYFHVEESGEYYIGIHAVSDADSYYLLVKDIKVTEGPSYDVPAAVSDVAATPGDKGVLTASISFKAPVKSLGGNVLTEDVTVTVYRNNVVIGTTTIAPGETGSITDNNAQKGINNYVLVSSNTIGVGDSYKTSCYCGLDTPPYVDNFKFTTTNDNLTSVMSWDAPTIGLNGGYINPEELVYTIYTLTADGNFVEPITEISELSYEIKVEDKTLQPYTYYVSAKNATGEGKLYGGNVVLGSPYTLPFIEKIEGTALVNSPWQLEKEDPESYATWGLGGVMEDYNLPEVVTAPDGGMAICYDFYEVNGGVCNMIAPKISLVGENSPTLYFSMYHYNADDFNELSVHVTADDATYEEIFAKKVNESATYGWTEYRVSLKEYKDAPWIAIMFKADITNNGFVFLDNIILENASENDVLVESLVAPTKATIGEEIELTAKVLNKGDNAASYEVSFYLDDEEIASMTGSEIGSNEREEYTAKFIPKAENIGKNTAKVVVTMTGATDEIESNNTAESEITISQPYLRVVTDLAATEKNGLVTLTWSEPELAPLPTVDNMEDYTSFITNNIGEYTIVDADNVETYGIDGYNIPLPNGPKAWQIWSPAEIGITTESWKAHESDKCLVAFSTITGAANDWLISPEIIGGTEISFWAAIPTNQYGAEQFEVLYSTTDTNTGSFKLISQESKGTTDWEQFVYNLPDDAKYFAIRYTSADVFALLIDDISYISSSSTIEINIMGYNVFCNGFKVNDADVTETTYEYKDADTDSDAFNVTVIYNEGESQMSNTATINIVGIEDLNKSGINIYGQDNYIKIENAAGRMISVYSIDGRVVCNIKSADSDIMIPMKSGVYIVEVDNSAVCKVLVR